MMSSHPDAEAGADPERLFKDAVATAQAGRLGEAAEKLEMVAALTADHPDVYWNLGTFRTQLQQHDRALAAWEVYQRLVPDDWRARPKIIQACQALGDTARRDRERDALLALREAGTDPELAREPRYCREQFRVGDHPVAAYEVFEPAGPQRVFYSFLVGNPDGTMIGEYSLGSYDATTEVSREMGTIGPNDRIYHLDRYDARGHSTYAFYNRLPSYDETRAGVVAALTGALAAVSGVTTSRGTGRADLYLSPQGSVPTETRMAHELGVVAARGAASPPPPPPAPRDATRVATGGRASGRRAHPLARPTPWERFTAWVTRLLGRGGHSN
jgi:tetratricopeptide (TPR) repeat protein